MERKLWGGRFKQPVDPLVARFNSSFPFDVRLLKEEIQASIAYAEALCGAGVLSADEAETIKSGLRLILERSGSDPGYLRIDVEDVHSFVEIRLAELIGDLAFKLHAGRSRNEQVSADMRLFLLGQIPQVQRRIVKLQGALVRLADKYLDVIVPSYTHLQRAQPALFAHYLLAFYEMLKRDHERLSDCRRRADACPLGSGAVSGTGYAIDRQALARALGFTQTTRNSIDAVSDRDFAVEFVFDCALLMTHLSRLAEDLILYASAEFGLISLGDVVSTGSSIMPQKKNPDPLELVRGKCGRVVGNLMTLLTVLKGLPLAYDKDMQEDKEPLFDTLDTVNDSLDVVSLVLDNIELNRDRAKEIAGDDLLLATELADYLVRKGLEFRKAHQAVGKLVLCAQERNRRLRDLSVEEFRSVCQLFDPDVYEWLDVQGAISRKAQSGGTAPSIVRQALEEAKRELERKS